MKVLRRISLITIVTASSGVQALGAVRAVGAGILYAAPSQGVLENPAVLPDGAALEIEGISRIPGHGASLSAVAGFGSVGGGLSWRKEPDSPDTALQGGGALVIGKLVLGGVVKRKGGTLDANAAAVIELSTVRFGIVARDVKGQPNRLDVGVGLVANSITIEFDVKKPRPFNSGTWEFDLGGALSAGGPLSIGLGYDFKKTDGVTGLHGDWHVAVVYSLANLVFLEAYYRPLAQEWDSAKYALGAKVVF